MFTTYVDSIADVGLRFNKLTRLFIYIVKGTSIGVFFVFSLSLLFSYSSFTSYMLKNLFNYFEHEIEFKNINTAWHPYKPYITLEELEVVDSVSKEKKIKISSVEFEFNLIKFFYLKPLDSLSAIGGHVTINDTREGTFNYQFNNFYGLKNISLRNISLSKKGISSKVYIERIYADFSSPSSSFYASLKDQTLGGNLTISLNSQFNQVMSDSFLGEIKMTHLNFNDPLIKALCSICSNLGKAEGWLKINYLNKKLVNLIGKIDLDTPSFLSSEGKLDASIGLSNTIKEPIFFIKSSYILENKKYSLPDLFLSTLNEKLKINIPQFKLSDPFIQLQIKKIFPAFNTNFSLSGDIQNFTGLFGNGGEYMISSIFRDIKFQERLGKSSYMGLEGKIITSNQKKILVRVDSPSLLINSEDFFDKKIVLNNLKGDFYLTSNEGEYELFNKSFSFYSEDAPFKGRLSFIPSSMYTLGDLMLSLQLNDVSANKVSNLIPNLSVTKYIKSWINNSINCGILDSTSLLYRGPADYKFLDTTSSFQMDLNLKDSCLGLTSINIEEIDLLGELNNTNFTGTIIKGNLFNSKIIADINISRDIHKVYHLAVEGESQGPVSSIIDLYDSYNTSLVDKSISGKHSTKFSFNAPLSNSINLLEESSLLRISTEISDASLVFSGEDFLLKNFYATADFNSIEGFKKSSLSFILNSIPMEFDLSTKKIEKELRTVISSESQIKLSQLFSFNDYSKFLSGSSLFDIRFTLPGYIRGQTLTNSQLNIESQLKGTELNFFSPFKKNSKSEIPFKVKLIEQGEKNHLRFSYGDLLRGRFVLRDKKSEGYIIAGPEKQTISILPNQIRLVGSFKEIDLRGLSKLDINSDSFSGNPLFIENLNIKRAKLSSAIIIDTDIKMKPSSKGTVLSLKNRDFSGSVLVKNNQEIDVKLDFLKINQNQTQEEAFFVSVFNAINTPISFSVESLHLGPKSYGNWSFKLFPSKDSLILLDIKGKYGLWGVAKNKDNEESKLVITKNTFGWDSNLKTRIYSGSPEKAFNQIGLDINFALDKIEFYPDIKWNGLPWEFELNKIVGEVGLFAEDITINNRDADIDTPNNLLRLISIFNVTDTFEKVTSLDFRKLYRSGFSADIVKGNIYIDSKSVKTVNPLLFKSGSSEFRWDGSVTKDRNGKYNILDLEVVMTLPLREYLPAYALILGGPLTAGIVYIAGKAFERNLDKLSSGKWIISGTLLEPKTNFEGWFED